MIALRLFRTCLFDSCHNDLAGSPLESKAPLTPGEIGCRADALARIADHPLAASGAIRVAPPAGGQPVAASLAPWLPAPKLSTDPAMPRPIGPRSQCSPNPFRRIRSAQQHGHWQQHVRHRARPAAGAPRPNRIGQPSDPASTAMTPSARHAAAARACDLSGSQPGLDAGIDLYHHDRCLRALRRGTPRSRQRLGGVSRTPSAPRHTDGAHEQDQRRHRATTTSPTSVTEQSPWSPSRETLQQSVPVIHLLQYAVVYR
jgi:hypothetical protein